MVKIRLMRMGSKKRPFYIIVSADVRYPSYVNFLEILCYYNPRTKPHDLKVDAEKVKTWIGNGAQPTNRVSKLLSDII